MPSLQTVWFVLIGVLLVGYAVLDGFDLGAGIVHLFVARNDEERRSVLNAIGPVWDGNEVWLITGGGALFAAFPLVYATVFSGFYLAVMLLLGALILRAVSIEFRSKETNGLWRRSWDAGFALGSALAALLFGVALGNVVRGLPLDAGGVYRGGLAGLLNPFAIVMGLLTLGLAAQQGSSWLVLKTEGALQARARVTGLAATLLVVAAWIVATVIAWGDSNRIFDNFGRTPPAWTGPVAAALALAAMLYAYRRRQELLAFLLSSVVVAGLAVTAGATLYPNLVPAADATRSLTVDNAHSSDITLTVMLIVALVGMPIVLAYTGYVYWKFKGKVQLDEAGY
ncbi:MAG: cytochrome d ubiquinol oxidase subunit II [Candidatus Limnocylindrales bacterium]